MMGEDVVHLRDLGIAEDTQDEVWLNQFGPQGWVLLTADGKISSRIHEKAAFKDYRWRGYLLKSAQSKAWKQFEEVVECWKPLVTHSRQNPEGPAFYRVDSKSFSRLGRIK